MSNWTSNQNINAWQPAVGLIATIGRPLLKYVAASAMLPDWADTAEIARAEELFMDYGAVSVTLLLGNWFA